MEHSTLKHILIIEDDLDINTVLQMALTEIGGLMADAAMTGREGVKIARLRRPQLIILDVNLPDIDGVQVLGALREASETRETPVLFLSASINELDRASLSRLGPVGFLAKPVDLQRLFSALDELWVRCGGTISRATA